MLDSVGFLVGFLRVLALLFIARVVMRAIHALLRPRAASAPSATKGAPGAGVPMVRDRVCNTFVPRERALAASIRGHEEHFCSEACRDKALAGVPRAS
jgi:YHS domain-containing protein